MSEETPAQRMKRALDERGAAWYNARFRKITLTADDIARLRFEVSVAPHKWFTGFGAMFVYKPSWDELDEWANMEDVGKERWYDDEEEI